MKKLYIFCFVLFCISIIVNSCNKEDEDAVLSVSSSHLKFTRFYKHKEFTIANSGTTALDWEVTSKPDWVTLSKDEGTVMTPYSITVIADPAMVPAGFGDLRGTITIESNGGTENVDITYLRGEASVSPGEGIGVKFYNPNDALVQGVINLNDPIESVDDLLNNICYFSDSTLGEDIEIYNDITNQNRYYQWCGILLVFNKTSINDLYPDALPDIIDDSIHTVVERIVVIEPYNDLTDREIGIYSSVDDLLSEYASEITDTLNIADTLMDYYLNTLGILFECNDQIGIRDMHIFEPIE